MFKRFSTTTLCILSLCTLTTFAETTEQAKKEQKKKEKEKRPFVNVIQKNGVKVSRRCFKDADNNGYCDNGSEQNWKCKNNCRIDKKATEEKDKKKSAVDELKKHDKKKETKKTTACGNCPFAGNCTGNCPASLS